MTSEQERYFYGCVPRDLVLPMGELALWDSEIEFEPVTEQEEE